MVERVIKKSLACRQDLLLGNGVVNQVRSGQTVQVDKIALSWSCATFSDLLALNTVEITHATVNCDGVISNWGWNGANWYCATIDSTLVGNFTDGFTYTESGQVGCTNSAIYAWTGPLPHVVVAGTDPALDSAYTDKSKASASNSALYFQDLADMVQTAKISYLGSVLHTKMHNNKSKKGSASYIIMTLADYNTTPDGELVVAQNRWVGSDYLLDCGLVAKRIQHGEDIDPYQFGYIGIGVIYNGPTVVPTPDPTQDESPVINKIGEYIKRGSPLDYGPGGSGNELLQKGAYRVSFPTRSVCNISEPMFNFPLYTDVAFNGTQVRPLSPFMVFNRRSNQANVSQCEINFYVFNTPEQIYEAAMLGNYAIGVGYLFIEGSVDPGFILDQFSTYSQIDVRQAWLGFDVSEWGIIFGDKFEKCNDYDSLSWGFHLDTSFDRISTTNVFDRCWKRALTRDVVQHNGFVYSALQHMSSTAPVEPGVTTGWEDYWQISKTSPTAFTTPTTQAAWVSGKFYRGMGKGYYLRNCSTTVMSNCAMDGGSDVVPGDVITTAGVTTHIDTFHLERHNKVKEGNASILVESGSMQIGTLYSAETRVQTGSRSTVKRNGVKYECIKSHTSSALTEPMVGANWRLYWTQVGASLGTSPDWALSTAYKSGNAVLLGATDGRRLRFDCVEEKGTANYGGKLIYVDGEKFAANAVITGEGIPSDSTINMAKQMSLKGFIDPIVEPIQIYNTTSATQWRPSLEDNGRLYSITIDNVTGAGCSVYIDGTLPQGSKFGFYVSNTASGVANQSGPIQLIAENGAFFVGPTSVQNGAIWVQKIGTATDGSANSWRTWIEGESSMSLPQLAPDLNLLSAMEGSEPIKYLTGINISSALTTALNITGKGQIEHLRITAATSTTNNLTVKLTVDEVVIWNSIVSKSDTTLYPLGFSNSSNPYMFNSSLKLELYQPSNTNASIRYASRPIK